MDFGKNLLLKYGWTEGNDYFFKKIKMTLKLQMHL